MNLDSGFQLTTDGSVVAPDGNVVFFSVARFKRDICEGDCCFVCGASPGEHPFNDEHVIPEWLLREFNLFSRVVTLPNGETCRYDRYKIPCCARCNSLLGERVEQPVSEILKAGASCVSKHARQRGPWLLFVWLCLIYIKTHLRDKAFRWALDTREASSQIGDNYEWEELHHIHCIARSCVTRTRLAPETLGSVLIVPAAIHRHVEPFDYADIYAARTVLVRIHDVAIVAVLNDSCACYSVEKEDLLPRLLGALAPVQLRELLAHFADLNLRIVDRPRFYSEFAGSTYSISATHPEQVELIERDACAYGAILQKACNGFLGLTI